MPPPAAIEGQTRPPGKLGETPGMAGFAGLHGILFRQFTVSAFWTVAVTLRYVFWDAAFW